jgi:hypothetical protein
MINLFIFKIFFFFLCFSIQIHLQSVAQPGFIDQWANFACVGKRRWAKWARFLLMGSTKY